MGLSNDLLTQFAKVTNTGKKTDTETTVYGTVVEYEGKNYVRIDGSDRLTPMTSTTQAEPGERVSIKIKNHTATVTGNISSPAVRVGTVEEIEGKVAVAIDSLFAANAEIDNLKVGHAEIVELVAAKADIEDLNAINATIENLDAKYATIEKLEAEYAKVDELDAKYAQIDDLDAVHADIHDLEVTFGKFEDLDVEELEANIAKIKNLDSEYANIDFANIGEAAIRKIFSDSGMIKDLVVGDGTITGHLVGVTISGDLIEGNTVKADKLVVKGSDGLYYKLNVTEGGIAPSEQVTEEDLQNGLHGSNIIAKTITAEKVSVNDLVAFDATIGGFNITESSLYSGVKSSVDNTTEGVYLDRDGQMNVGGTSNYFKYYKTEDGSYKLAIAAGSIVLGASGKNVEDSIDDAQNSADEANQFADENKTRLENAEASIQLLKDAISMLVTDENGASLMTQTSDGWTFNISNIQSALDHTSENLENLIEEYGSLEAVIAILQSRIDDLDGLAEYVRIGTYEEYDENGDVNTRPCIYLGEGDSDFKLRITNTEFNYMDGPVSRTSITQDGMATENMKVTGESTQSGLIEITDEGDDTYITEIEYIWSVRSNGNYGLKFQGFLGY